MHSIIMNLNQTTASMQLPPLNPNRIIIVTVALIGLCVTVSIILIGIVTAHNASAIQTAITSRLALLQPRTASDVPDEPNPLSSDDTASQSETPTQVLTPFPRNKVVAPNGRVQDPAYPDPDNDGIIDPADAPKPESVDPETERIVAQIESILSKKSLSQEEYAQLEQLFNQLQEVEARRQSARN